MLTLLVALPFAAWAESRTTLEISGDIEVDIVNFGDRATDGITWFACSQGEDSAEFASARKLTRQGFQIYFPDMLSANFLSPLPSNIARVPGSEVARVIQHILTTTSAERIYLVGGARAAVVVIRGLADKHLQQSGLKLKGALLIAPRILKKRPEPV